MHRQPLANESQAGSQTGNPYAPPRDFVEDQLGQPGSLSRQGDLLLIGQNAVFPKRCFVTGVDSAESVEVRQLWHPGWVYLWLLPGVIPYFFVSPFFSRRVSLRVPVSAKTLGEHLRLVHAGVLLMFCGAALFASGVVLAAFLALAGILLVPAVVLGLAGFFFASRQTVALRIVTLRDDVLTVAGVHPRVLEVVRDETANS